jgi:hypothetical protein
MRTDTHLGVVRSALESFKSIAQLYELGNIDIDNLKQLLKEQSIIQSYELNNIDMDRSEKWWKELIITQLLGLGNLDIDGFEQ